MERDGCVCVGRVAFTELFTELCEPHTERHLD